MVRTLLINTRASVSSLLIVEYCLLLCTSMMYASLFVQGFVWYF